MKYKEQPALTPDEYAALLAETQVKLPRIVIISTGLAVIIASLNSLFN